MIGYNAFYNCTNLETLKMGKAVKRIKGYAFEYCGKLTSVTIPNAVETVESGAFESCTGLTHVTIGRSVKTMDWGVFYGCDALTRVNCLALTPPAINYGTFNRYTATLGVPEASLQAYKAAQYWKNFTTMEGIPGAGPGDVNGDGTIAIGDVTNLINLLLTSGEVPVYADVDGDGVVSIQDITALINKILTGDI